MSMAATILLYSGRPNPSWELGADRQAVIRALIAQSPRAEESCEMPDGLGYNGVVLSIRGRDGREERWQVFDGRVVSASGCRIDCGRLIERTLLDSGRDVIDPSILSSIIDGPL
jgi:hypothetical protein